MAEQETYLNEFIKIIEGLPEKDNFAKVAKVDVLFRICEFAAKRFQKLLLDSIRDALDKARELDKSFHRNLIERYIGLLISLERYQEAFKVADENKIDPRLVVDLMLDSIGSKLLEFLDIIPEKVRDYSIIRTWLTEAQKDNIDEALSEIMKLKDSENKFFALLELARTLIDKNEKEKAKEIVEYIREKLENVDKKYISSLLSMLLHVKCKLEDEDCVGFFEQSRQKINKIDFINFMPELTLFLIKKNQLDRALEIVESIEDQEKKDVIILGIVQKLAKENHFRDAVKACMKINDKVMLAQAYMTIAKHLPIEKIQDISAYCRLAFDQLVRWLDESLTLIHNLAEKIRSEDKNYEKMSPSQIIFYHPQVSTIFRNITSIFLRGLQDITNILVEKELFDDALHILNYACTLRKFGCSMIEPVHFQKLLKTNEIEKAINILKTADINTFRELLTILNRSIEDKEKLKEILLEISEYLAENNDINRLEQIVNTLLNNTWNDEALKIADMVKDEKDKAYFKLRVANNLIDQEKDEKTEEIINYATEIFNKVPLEESLNIARILALVLFKLEKYDKVLEIIKKYASGKDPWLAGLIVNTIFSSY